MVELVRRQLLLVDNSADYRRSLRALLRAENYQVEEAASVEEAMVQLDRMHFDLALVDLRMADELDTDMTGLDVVTKATEMHVPSILITQFPSVSIARMVLRSRGATPLVLDYVPKEHGPQALLDAIEVVFNNLAENHLDGAGRADIQFKQNLAWFRGTPLDLSRYQYALLVCLFQKNGAPCSPEELIEAVYGEPMSRETASADKRLERLVDRVREKIEDDPGNPKRLLKVHGRGYRLA